jgi:hypothetical protein
VSFALRGRNAGCAAHDPDPVVAQIGAVKLGLEDEFPILEKYKTYVRPIDRFGHQYTIDPYFTDLTDITNSAIETEGVMDMLRFDQFTGGAWWIGEYGNPATEPDFRNLLSYSPYHNIRAGQQYPAILVTTADADDRVVPAHSFKYVAALQAADIGARPRLLRIDTRSGHGTGKPTSKVIQEAADMLAFGALWTGLRVNDGRRGNSK